MDWSASMDFFKSRASPSPPSPSSDSTLENVNVSSRTGVESREEVLRQVREKGWEIIEIDPDPVPAPAPAINRPFEPHSYQLNGHTQHPQSIHRLPTMQKRTRDPSSDTCTQATKQRKLSDGMSAYAGHAQTGQHQSAFGLTSNSASNVFTAREQSPRQKKSLWGSDNALENMLKISSLSSPETTSSGLSIESTSPPHGNGDALGGFNSSSWSFEKIGELDAIDSSVSAAAYDGQNNSNQSIGGSSCPPPGQDVAASHDFTDQRKRTLEQTSVAESQRLRAQHRNLVKRPSLIRGPGAHRQTSPQNSKVTVQHSGHEQDTAQSNNGIRSSNRDEDDPAEIERCFDILLNEKRPQQRPPATGNDRQQGVRSDRGRVNQPNPYTREAAERWRTQSRHLDHSRRPVQIQSHEPATDCEVLDEHSDEMRLARVRATAYQKNLAKSDREAEQRLLSKKFYGVDLEDRSKKKSVSKSASKPKSSAKTQAQVQTDLRNLMGTTESTQTFHEIDNDEVQSDVDMSHEKSADVQQRNLPTPTLSALSQLNSVTTRPGSVAQLKDLALSETFDNLPEQSTSLQTRPQNFDRFQDSEKQLYIERETKKEREKDLDLIRQIYQAAAELGSLGALDTGQSKLMSQMASLKKFAEAVLIHQKSGIPIRNQIKSIHKTLKRQLAGIGKEPDRKVADRYLSLLVQPKLFDLLVSESRELKNRLLYLVQECNRINSYYLKKADTKNRSRAKVSFSAKDSTGKLTGSKSKAHQKPPTAKQKIAELRGLLGQYDQDSQDLEDEGEVIDLGPSRNDDDDSDASEEDEGEEFMRPAGFQEPTSLAVRSKEASSDKASYLQSDPEQAGLLSVPNSQASQAVDQQLLNSMLAKKQQQDHLKSQGVQKSDLQIAQEARQRKSISKTSLKGSTTAPARAAGPDDSEEEADHDVEPGPLPEFDDTDIDTEGEDEDSDSDNEPVCRRYITKGVCHGLSREHDEYEHDLGKFLNKEKARAKVLVFKEWFKEQVPICRPELKCGDLKETMHETAGSLEQKVVFGDGEDAACRAWFTEELYHPSKDAYRKAKVYRACQPTSFWVVDWERTIGPCKEQEESDDANNEATDTDDDDEPDTPESENSPEEDARVSHSSSSIQTTLPEPDHDMDKEPIPKESLPPNDSFDDSDNPVDSSFTSSAATLVSDTNGSTKDCQMHDVDTSTPADIGKTDATEDMDDLFGGELDSNLINADAYAGTNPPTPLSGDISPTEPPSQSPSTQHNLPPPSQLPQTTITRPTYDQFRGSSNRALANRRAKELFMHWFIERLPNPGDHCYIRIEDESMEEELKRIGDHSCWSREEDFNETVSGPDGEMKVNDRLRVWVREMKIDGPRN